MEARMAKALHIAATTALRATDDGLWKVPSQSGNGTYTVSVGADLSWSCSCPDFETRLQACKHIMSVEITVKRERSENGVTYSETTTVKCTQNWPAYNRAQCDEKRMVLSLLNDLCATIPQPAQTSGRPRLPLSTMAFSSVYKVYAGFSARRFNTDLIEAAERGLIERAPAFNSVLKYMRKPEMTPVLSDLVQLSALPLKVVEQDFAVDSTGFGAKRMRTWYSTKHGKEMQVRDWRKLHAMVGVKTHIVTACEVSDPTRNDAPYLPELAKTTAKHFTMSEVSADKGYLSVPEQRGGDRGVGCHTVDPIQDQQCGTGTGDGVGSHVPLVRLPA